MVYTKKDVRRTLAFVHRICEDADTRRQRGDWSGMTRIKNDPALRYYFDNVYKLGNVNPEAFAALPMFTAVNDLREAYDAQQAQEQTVAQNDARLTSLESKLDALIARLEPVIEAATEDEDEDEEPEAPAADPDAEADADASDDASDGGTDDDADNAE